MATCPLNLSPSCLLKASWEVTGNWILAVVNSSLIEGVILLLFKEAVVYSLFRKPLLIWITYPITNLLFLGKIVEKEVFREFKDYLDPFPSVFRTEHGTDTPLFAYTVHSWWERDWSGASILALLDLLTSFKTIHHGVFLDQTQELGLGGTELFWFSSFP